MVDKMRHLNQYGINKRVPLKEHRLDRHAIAYKTQEEIVIKDDAYCDLVEFEKFKEFESENSFVKFKNDPRITKVGKFIRNTSIDELPQLFNILKGDMSVVGNRPLPCMKLKS